MSNDDEVFNPYREEPVLERTFLGHKCTVTKACFSFDGSEIMSASLDKSVRIWNFDKVETCVKFDQHRSGVLSIDCSKDHIIASGSKDGSVFISKGSGKDGVMLRKHSQPVSTVQFSPDGQQLLTGSHDKTIKLWSVKKKQFLCSFVGHTNWVQEAVFSPINSLIVSCSDDGTVRIWDKYTATCIKYIKDLKVGTGVSFQRSGNAIAVSNSAGSVCVIDIRKMALLQEYKLHNNCTSVSWYTNVNYFATCGLDGNIFVVDAINGCSLCGLNTKARLNCIRLNKDGTRWVCVGNKMVMVVMVGAPEYMETHVLRFFVTSSQEISLFEKSLDKNT